MNSKDQQIKRIASLVDDHKQRQKLIQLMRREVYNVQMFTVVQNGADLPAFVSDETPDIDSEEIQSLLDKDGE